MIGPMQSKATTVKQYLAELPAERRTAIEAVRKVVLKNLDSDYEEGMQYGMIGFYIPHRIYPPGYHCDPRQPLPFACLASRKNYMSLYLGCVYGDHDLARWFRDAWAKTGKKLDMGKSCVRFRKVEDLALDVIGEAIRRMPAKLFVSYYESVLKTSLKESRSKKTRPVRPKQTASRPQIQKPKAGKHLRKSASKK